MDHGAHVERAEKAYVAFKVLRKEGLLEDAASRGYYAIMHLARALLIKKGEGIPKTHSGLLARLWIKREELGLEEGLVKGISRAYSARERGDYGVIPSVSEEDLDPREGIIRELQELVEDD